MSDWEQATALFGAARLLKSETRASFLDASCDRDPALRAEVERLLADDAREDSFLSTPSWVGEALPLLPTALAPGDLVNNRYRVEASIAGGGQAVVYRATDTVLSRPVVVKVMRGSGRHNRVLKSRFEQEMLALSRIDHPGVVGILDVGELADGCPFLVIQYVPGISLREVLQKGPLERRRTARLLREIGSALSAAHAAGVAHRDVKPENVMVQPFGAGETVKLIDFGICKIDRSGLDPGVTSVIVEGTIRYMAPEQFHGDNSPACDVYALALMVCEMLCGHPNDRALADTIGTRPRELIEKALAFRAEDRPHDLLRWCDQLATALERTVMRRRHVLRIAAALSVIAAAGTAGAHYLPSREPEPRRLIQKVGAFDPLDEGFQTHNDIRGTVAENPAHNGYDGWRVSTERQGHYFKNLTAAEKRLALARGWKLTAVMRAEEGRASAIVDFTGIGSRFDIVVERRGTDQRALLETQIVPVFDGMYLPWERADDAYHTYELLYDPGLQTASLWVDGTRRLTGYRGHSQFQTDGDVIFGVSVFESARGVASFQTVRFEINP